MDSHILLRNLTSGENKIGNLPSKTIRIENTPRKVPFKDATNQSSMFKTPAGKIKGEISIKNENQSTMKAPKLQIETPLDDYDFDFPPSTHNGCFCGGIESRMSEMELINQRFITPEFMELLNFNKLQLHSLDDSLDYDDLKLNIGEIKPLSPYSPTKSKMLNFNFDDDLNGKDNDSGFSRDDIKPLNINIDFDCSIDFEVPPLESDEEFLNTMSDEEDSFIKDW